MLRCAQHDKLADLAVTPDVRYSLTSLLAPCEGGAACKGFPLGGAHSTRNDAPEKASRPFDKDRDGFIMGEGAGIVILETLEHAQARGAKIYAELAGYGATDDAYHITAPNPTGASAIKAMQRALADADAKREDVQYINAHGTSTALNDKTETKAKEESKDE